MAQPGANRDRDRRRPTGSGSDGPVEERSRERDADAERSRKAIRERPREHERDRILDRLRNVDRDWATEEERPSSAGTHVLVPYDDSGPARDALDYSFELFPEGEVTALTIVDDGAIPYIPDPSGGPRLPVEVEARSGGGAQAIERVAEIAGRHDETVEMARRVGSPTRGILEYVESHDVDHVVIGSHGRSGISRLLLGSVAEVVVRHSPVPVTVVPATDGADDW